MDLVGIFHVVDTPSSGKCDFNHIYVVGLIQSILIQFFLIQFILVLSLSLSLSLWCSSMFMLWSGYCPISAGFCHHFLTVCFSSEIQGVVLYSVDMCGSRLLFGIHR